ncbi:MAG: suppressor for copper-sensitivity B [Paracoccaceae bacterium]
MNIPVASFFRKVGAWLLILFAIWLSVFAPEQSQAAQSDTFSNPAVTAQLISAENGVTSDAGTVSLGLALTFGEGWKGYWRTPGEVGLAPQINWSGSTNLGSVEIFWPAPERFEAFGIENFGYSKEVVLPIRVMLTTAGQPLDLKARVSLLTCSNVCVPNDFELALSLPSGVGIDTASAKLIAINVARVPDLAHDSNIEVLSATIDAQATSLVITARSTDPFTSIDVFPEFGPLVTFGKPDIRFNYDRKEVWAQLPVNAWSGDHSAPSITITDTGRAVTAPISLTSDAPPPPYSFAASTPDVLQLIAVAMIAFLGGLILNVMPCVLPVLSIKLSSIVKASGQSPRVVRNGFLFCALGVLTFVWGLATVLLVLKWIGVSVGWGVQFQSPVFVTFMFVVMVVFSANLFGAFEISLPAALQDRLGPGQHRSGYIADFGTGLLAAVLATPCSAPFLGTAVAFALAGRPLDVVIIFTALGLGLALPYLLVAARPDLINRLPRPGKWMVFIKTVLGGLLLAAAIWLLFVLVGVAGFITAGFVASTTAVLVLASSTEVSNNSSKRVLLSAFFLATLFGAGIIPNFERGSTAVAAKTYWQAFEPGSIARHVSEGNTVFVDVTADWCLTCKANKSLVLDRSPVSDRLAEISVIAMQADWTRPNEDISRFLERHNRYGIPFNVVYGPGAPAGLALPEILTPTLVLDAIEAASTRSNAGD